MIENSEMLETIENEILLENIGFQFQPIYSVNIFKISHVEILARWHNSEFGIIPPDIFIPIAEKRGILHLIGQKMLINACDFLSYCKLFTNRNIKININMSPSELSELNYEFWLNKLQFNEQKKFINIELTEQNNLLDNYEIKIGIIKKFQNLGLGLYIDDFGSGFSGFQYIRLLNANCIKLDKILISKINTSKKDKKIIKAIINFAHDLNIQVVAEGVESKSQFEMLKKMNCDFVQGFYICKPLDEEDFLKILHLSETIDKKDEQSK